ncbi:nucleophile aminohydrolase [Endogone sp. FLAS-F59071]|nr:nucleophile aminohydrolase [Endogone sp. FLAS-F59071]|eukprot:RUS13736.1 nucleophile aminohydrolase [Endogone sp. FLAS-F59071]
MRLANVAIIQIQPYFTSSSAAVLALFATPFLIPSTFRIHSIHVSPSALQRQNTYPAGQRDGFGVGWYEHDADPEIANTPCIFTSVTPAWNNINLIRLAEKIKSELVFAHVRASTSGAVSETNCHPWQFGRFMWMHNGSIAEFHKATIKRLLQNTLREELFLFVQGNTDSELAFALFLNQLEDPLNGSFDHVTLKRAMLKTIELINQWSEQVGITEPSLLNFAVTDGESVVCTRYISSSTEEAASLYFSSGTRFESYKPGHYRMVKADRREDIVVVASEPLTFEKADWLTIPTNTVLVITSKFNVLLYPIRDQYYNPDARQTAEQTSRDDTAPLPTSEPVAPQPIQPPAVGTYVRRGEVEKNNNVESADIGGIISGKPNSGARGRNPMAASSTLVTGFKDRDNDAVLGNGCAAKEHRLSGPIESSRAGARDLFRERERDTQKEKEKERGYSNGGFGLGAVPLQKRVNFKARVGATGRDSSSMKVVSGA